MAGGWNGHWRMSCKVINDPYWFFGVWFGLVLGFICVCVAFLVCLPFFFFLINNVMINFRGKQHFSKSRDSPVFSSVIYNI